MTRIPLSLYVHIPWCVQKCPYCDFNSHRQTVVDLPESSYVAHLLDDLSEDSSHIIGRQIETIFIGGGTPSLFSEVAIDALLKGIRERVDLASNAEITLEANPGTVEANRFTGYVEAGVNRFSVGVQSFSSEHLKTLGRIHDDQEAIRALQLAKTSGISTFNLDLMHGLPEQSVTDAIGDLNQAIALQPPHISWYQLTIEPNTPFYSKPPELPEDDILCTIQEQGHELLEGAGYRQYEVSAYSKPEQQCRHNTNYWRFGDYLGIGCGAHGKISKSETGEIRRITKVRNPKSYMSLHRSYISKEDMVEPEQRAFEFFMNRFRLHEACPIDDFAAFTFQELDKDTLISLQRVADQGLVNITSDSWQLTRKGHRFLNSILTEFV